MSKFNLLLLLLLFINSINSIIHSEKSKKTYYNILRNLWEEDMEIPSGRPENDEDSLERCSKSSYKYFSYVLTGVPVSFDHTLNDVGSVR
jgi:hypothetical protein